MQPYPKIIGLDLDGVIIDHTENKLAVSRSFGVNLKREETVSDVMDKKIEPEIYKKIQKMLYNDPAVAYKAALMPGAKEGLAYLTARKFPYFLISRRESRESAVELLKIHGLWPKYFSAVNAFFVKTKKDKEAVSKRLGVTHFIDDQPSVLSEIVSVKNKFLFDHLGVYGGADESYVKLDSWPNFLTYLV